MACRVLALSLCSAWLSCSDDAIEDVVPWEIPRAGSSLPGVPPPRNGVPPPFSFIDAAAPSLDAGTGRDASLPPDVPPEGGIALRDQ